VLKDQLSNKAESLDLCHKMLKRIDRVFPQIAAKIGKDSSIPSIRKKPFQFNKDELGRDEKKLEKLKKHLTGEIEEIRRHNYRVIRQKKELKDSLINQFVDFFRQYFLPIMDGLMDGRKNFQGSLKVWIEKYPQHEALVQKRRGVYDTLLGHGDGFLGQFFITRIPVTEGELFNESVHDPVMVEECAEMENNRIKEVSRQGYQFAYQASDQIRIIRAPQVTVVKNA
jgi:molecular chaperone GrpE (heat shock protein)